MNIALIALEADSPSAVDDRDDLAFFVSGLAHAFGALGHRAIVFVRQSSEDSALRISSAATNVTVIAVEPGQFVTGLRAVWANDPPDAIHAFGSLSGKAAIGARATNLPVVLTFSALDKPLVKRSGIVPSEQAAIVGAAARIIAVSSAQVFGLLRLGANPAAIALVPCGIDLSTFAPLRDRDERLPARRLRIGTHNGLGEGGGVADVIDALTYLPGVELAVGGGRHRADWREDPDAVRLAARANDRGVADRVEFRGALGRTDVAPFFRSLDIVVCVPHGETLGVTALQAMACGVPVVVSALGGLADAVVDGMTGIHVPPRAPRQLAYAIESLGADEARRRRLGRLGVERATERFRWGRIAAQTIDVYRSVGRGDRSTLKAAYEERNWGEHESIEYDRLMPGTNAGITGVAGHVEVAAASVATVRIR